MYLIRVETDRCFVNFTQLCKILLFENFTKLFQGFFFGFVDFTTIEDFVFVNFTQLLQSFLDLKTLFKFCATSFPC